MGQLITERRFDKVRSVEAVEGSPGQIRFEAVVSEGDFINQNGRKYPMGVLWPAFERLNDNPGKHPGTVDHPDPFTPVSVSDLGIAWEMFHTEGNQIIGRGRTIDTAKGRDLKAVMEAGIPVGFSTRGRALFENQTLDGQTVRVVTKLDLETVDAVTDPSVGHARIRNYTKEDREVMDDRLFEAVRKEADAAARATVAEGKVQSLESRIETLENRAKDAESKLAVAEGRVAELESELSTVRASEAKNALEGKLAALTADDRFGPTIRTKAVELGVTLENAETVVATLRSLVQDKAASANEDVDGPEPKGVVTSTEDDIPAPATEDVSLDDLDEDARYAAMAGLR